MGPYILLYTISQISRSSILSTLIKYFFHSLPPLPGQKQRDVTINQFRQGKFQVLVATDVAARGIDISNIGLVIQYHLPHGADIYVHRSGRTGRAGRPGIIYLSPDFEAGTKNIFT